MLGLLLLLAKLCALSLCLSLPLSLSVSVSPLVLGLKQNVKTREQLYSIGRRGIDPEHRQHTAMSAAIISIYGYILMKSEGTKRLGVH